MKRIIYLLLLSPFISFGQCDLNFDYINTGANMTAFFMPSAASSIHAELGDGTIGSFYTDADGSFVCAASVSFNGSQIQLAVMADDSTSPEKDGFSSGEPINWFYETSDGSIFSITPTPNDNFTINGISFIQSATISAIDCSGDDTSNGDQCPSLDFDFVNTGSNMTLLIVPDGAATLSALGNGTIGVYYVDNDGQQLCGGASAFSGSQVQITAMADDSTSPEKDGFTSGESIVWKFEDTQGNQFNLTPTPQDGFALNGISLITGISYDAISCAVDVEGCTNENYIEYNPNASIDDGSCLTLIVEGCTDEFADNYNSNANIDDGSCFTSILGCMDASACNYNSTSNTDDASCYYPEQSYDCDGNCIVDTDGDGVCDEFEIVGCQDPTADNYDPNATDSQLSGGDQCPPLDFSFLNTGSSMTLFLTSGAVLSDLGNGTVGVYFTDDNGAEVCGGSAPYTGGQVQISAMGDDATTTEKDGFSAVEAIVWKFEDNNGNQYNLSPTPQDNWVINGISFITGFTHNAISCGGSDISCEYLGCSDSSYLEYWNSTIVNIGEESYYYLMSPFNELVNQDDGSCSTLLVEGCTDSNFLEYNPAANVFNMDLCQTIIVYGCTDETSFNYSIVANTDDGSCYPFIEGCMDHTAFNYVQPTGDVFIDINTSNQEMCIPVIYGCLDPDAYNFNDYDSDGGYNLFTGIPSVDVNTDDGSCVDRVYGCLDNDYIEYNVLANTDDGSCEILYSVAYDQALNTIILLEEGIQLWNIGINLQEGWNMFGYGCPQPINIDDLLGSFTSIYIIKNNNGEAYWPEFGFNGIGEFMPGFGYQIKVTESIQDFNLCNWYINDFLEE